MLLTTRKFAGEVTHLYVEAKVIPVPSGKNRKSSCIQKKQANALTLVYHLVIPRSYNGFIFDLMMIIKHKKLAEKGEWEICVADNFVMQKTNLLKLLSYAGVTSKNAVKKFMECIQQELNNYSEQLNLKGKTFIEIDEKKKVVALGYIGNK